MAEKKTAPTGVSEGSKHHRKKANYRTVGSRSLSATMDDHWKREGVEGYSMHAAKGARHAIESIVTMVGEKVVEELVVMKKHHKRGTVTVENVIGAIKLLTSGQLASDAESMLRQHVAVLGIDIKKHGEPGGARVLVGAAKLRHEAKLAREAEAQS
jgi:histone H3/H4